VSSEREVITVAEHGRNKTGAVRDDEIKKEMQGELKSARSTRAEESREMQPRGEDQPETDLAPDTTLIGGVPSGMTAEGVELRSELARHLGRSVYPADREAVLATLRDNNAPDRLLRLAEELPEGTRFANVGAIGEALGIGAEDRRR
jgi:hypothetical protein